MVLLVLLAVALSYAVIQLRIRQTTLEISGCPLRAGGRVKAFVSQPGDPSLRRLTVRLACDEVAEYRAGTTTSTDTKRVRSINLFEETEFAGDREPPFGAAFEFDVPADVMHSFAGEHNRVQWLIIVAGEFHGWPGFERQFPVVIHPSCGEEAQIA
jgi:hypothetical protein